MGGWLVARGAGGVGAQLLATGARRWVVATFARFSQLGATGPVPVLRAHEARTGLLVP